ncbi:hypothetical protein [Microbulbifer sp. JMSA002]|uniref:hypothetical protein n=1 Tax=Microbulbifer sp. JMSA002 TaxID=3243368 RepID=UPI00403A4ACE
MEKTKPFRKLGAQESLFMELAEKSNGAVQLLVFFRACKPLGVERLLKGMKYLHNLHPMLRSRIEKMAYAHWFCDVDFEDIPLEIHKNTPSISYQVEFKRLARKKIELDKYSYRLNIYLDKHGNVIWVAFIVSHAAIDGRSVLILIRDLDRYLRGHERNKTSASIMDKSVVEYVCSRKNIKRSQLTERINDCTPLKWPVEKAVAAPYRRGCSIYQVLPKKNYDRLHLLFRQKNIQATSIYSAVAILAARSLPSFQPKVELMLPINAQQLCKPLIDKEVVGECTTTITLSLSPEDTSLDLLSLARLIQKKVFFQLRNGVFYEPPIEPNFSPSEIENLAKSAASQKDHFSSGVCVSNMGDVHEITGPLKFFDFGLVMTVQNHGAHPIMLVTYTLNEQEFFVFGYCEPLVSSSSALKYVKTYMELITDISNGYVID